MPAAKQYTVCTRHKVIHNGREHIAGVPQFIRVPERDVALFRASRHLVMEGDHREAVRAHVATGSPLFKIGERADEIRELGQKMKEAEKAERADAAAEKKTRTPKADR